ncbi:MAG: hypothetical protein ACKON7_09275, partial [Planctomycetaceae bacterium]
PVLLALGGIGLVPVGAAALGRAAEVRGGRSTALGWLAGCGGLTVALAAAFAAPQVGRATGVRELVAVFQGRGDADAGRHDAPTVWSSYRCSVPTLVYYTGAAARGERVAPLAKPHEAKRFLEKRPRAHVVVPARRLAELLAVAPPGHRVLARVPAVAGYRELVLVGPADDRGPASLAESPTEARLR